MMQEIYYSPRYSDPSLCQSFRPAHQICRILDVLANFDRNTLNDDGQSDVLQMLLAERLNIELQQVSTTLQHVVESSDYTCKSDHNHSETCYCDRPFYAGLVCARTYTWGDCHCEPICNCFCEVCHKVSPMEILVS
jgi:hypothetical protein